MMRTALVIVALVASLAPVRGTDSRVAANPIRKVVTMLQAMVQKVTLEGEKETELFNKYMCWCKNGGGDLAKSIADAEEKLSQLPEQIKEAEAKLAQLKEDIVQHKADRVAAKQAIADATALREKAAAVFANENAEYLANVASIEKAVTALEAGMGAGFLQTNAAQALRRLVASKQDMLDADREDLQSFLNVRAGYAPQSGQIVGILKQMKDEMDADGKAAQEQEEAAIKVYGELLAAKKKEIAAATKMIEEKLTRVGDLGVEVANMKNDLGDTAEALEEDKKFLADLEKNCAVKTKEHEENVRMRGLEVVALADTIKVLNDDDSMELFKKTLPSASASFIQVKFTNAAVRSRALSVIQLARNSNNADRPQLDFIALALRNKKIGFAKVIKMIDEMVATLKQEQLDDEAKKDYCGTEFDAADDKKKGLERSISDLETEIATQEESISTLKEELEALEAGIQALDKAVTEATSQRQEENQAFKELMAADSAAKEILSFAKNRLNKFYNPKLYKPAAKRELTEAERITVNNGGTLAPTNAPAGVAGTGIAVLAQQNVAPPPPPETAAAYKKSGEESSGVTAMIDLLIKDLDKELTLAQAEEKDAQEDYEKAMADAADKRAQDSKSMGEKAAAKAEMEADLQTNNDGKVSANKELGSTLQYINSLHLECDWLLQYYSVRREARAGEIDALGKAKAVLSGADYSLLQTSAHNSLRR